MSKDRVSKRTIEYVESNIESEITLSQISRQMSYSKFHFHRMFLAEMGLSVTAYVLRRKLIHAAYALKDPSRRVLDIAMAYGFGNVDTFTRNFKQYFGVTPRVYRQRGVNFRARGTEGDVKMQKEYMRIQECTKEDRHQAITVLDRMVALSKIAHGNGLLSLEENLSDTDLPFLHKAVELLLKGMEIDELRRILTNYLMATDHTPPAFFQRVLVLEGIIHLHRGTYPWDVQVELAAYFGEEFISVLDSGHGYEEGLTRFLKTDHKPVEGSRLAKEFKQMPQRSLQRLLRECDILLIALACMSLEEAQRQLVVDALPKGRKRSLVEASETLEGTNFTHIVDASKDLVSVIQRLRLDKEIR